jgi:catechol 2,3-dioxygenase-like lactoylglutathione lyase family enzyme
VISRLSHATVWVLDQEEARRFYTEKLGFEVRVDQTMDGGFRWLTVGPKDQPDLQLVLMLAKASPYMDEESAAAIRTLVAKGALGPGVLYTPNCRETYEELKRRGVEFIQPPEDRFYGTEALLKDNSGNRYSMTTPNPQFAQNQNETKAGAAGAGSKA